jgi:phosphoribosyl-ATP pyrophosphohydrolase/phosphoribosyl-AMP cyclohydrolase
VTSPLAVPTGVAFDERGLAPVVAQDRSSGDVLMLAWANADALRLTADTGLAHFWSRSRGRLWKKGESSGHTLRVVEIRADCDGDTLLYVADADGPACHTGRRTCFGEGSPTLAGVLDELQALVRERRGADPEGSYTARLHAKGLDHVLKKIGEEATEVVLAAKGESDERLANEAADLLFHLVVAFEQRGVPFARALAVLAERRRGR